MKSENNFRGALSEAQIVENNVAQLLTLTGLTLVETGNDGKWDLKMQNPSGGFVTLEVKNDKLVYLRDLVAIEFQCRGKDSGIMTTESDYWVHVMFYETECGNHDTAVSMGSTQTLREMIANEEYEFVDMGGEGMVSKMFFFDRKKYLEKMPRIDLSIEREFQQYFSKFNPFHNNDLNEKYGVAV